MKRNLTLPILTLGHFLIDLACLYFLFSYYPQNGYIAGIQTALLYNFLAFALQTVIGYFFDRFPAKRSTSIGILFILCGYLCGLGSHSAAGLLFCGLGNAFYHAGGSIGIAHTDTKGLRDSGIFVSAGAPGVALGTFLATKSSIEYTSLINRTSFSAPTVWILLLLIILLFMQTQVSAPAVKKVSAPIPPQIIIPGNVTINSTAPDLPAGAATTLLLLSLAAVFLRSLGGLFFPTSYRALFTLPEDTTPAVFLLAMSSGIAAFLGKFLGGFLSSLCTMLLHKFEPSKKLDIRSGNYLFGTITLLLSALLLTMFGNIPLLCFVGILCFQAAMPVTLFELYCILPDHAGFAMGLSTLMLFLGSLPAAFVPMNALPAPLVLCVLTLLAAGCMSASHWIYRHETYPSSNNKEDCP